MAPRRGESGRAPGWLADARALIDRLWVCERMILILLGPALHRSARDYASAVDHVLWEDLGGHDHVGDRVRSAQTELMTAAHRSMSTP
jgi:hypothetical protein